MKRRSVVVYTVVVLLLGLQLYRSNAVSQVTVGQNDGSRAEQVAAEDILLSADIEADTDIESGIDTEVEDKLQGATVASGDVAPFDRSDDVAVDMTPAIALVFDDCGFSMAMAERTLQLKVPMTWAIIPGTRFGLQTAQLLRSHDVPYLIHLPMQAQVDADGRAGSPNHYLIGVGMSEEAVSKAVEPIIAAYSGAYGLNNHRGSKATSDKSTMESLMKALSKHDLFFLDSNTSSKTVGFKTAREFGIRTDKNAHFLDNSAEREKMNAQFDMAVKRAKKNGYTIAICHMRPDTITFLADLDLNALLRRGVRLVTLPELEKLRQAISEEAER